jgi:integrase
MATTSTYIGVMEVNRAAGRAERAAKARQAGEAHPDAAMDVFADVALKGLRIIAVNGTASWVIKTRTHTKTLGYIFPKHDRPLTAPEKARELGGQVKSLLKTDPDQVDQYIAHRHAGRSHSDALEMLRARPDTWTFEKCIDVMIEDRQDPHHKDRIKPSTVKDIRSAFNRACLKDLKVTPAAALTRADFEAARDTIRKENGVSSAQKFIAWVRSVYSYMAEAHSGSSGITGRDRWWELLHATHAVKPKTRNPEIADIVRSLVIAEEYLTKPLPGRSVSTPGVGAGVLAGLWWVVMTAQRADAALSLKTYNLIDDTEREEGWKIAAWDGEDMKAGKSHMLPIPPRAASHIESIRSRATHHGSEQWAFPSDRHPDKHATVSGTYRIMYRLAGRDALEQKRPEGWQPKLKKDGTPRAIPSTSRTERRDLLAEADVEWWSGHDVRRRIQTVLDDAGIPGGSSVILAHEVKTDVDLSVSMTQQQRDDFMRQRQARITKQAYGGAMFLKLKGEAMQIWTDALLDEYDRQTASPLTEREAELIAAAEVDTDQPYTLSDIPERSRPRIVGRAEDLPDIIAQAIIRGDDVA